MLLFKINKEYHLFSDLKYNEGYAKANLNELNEAVKAFTQSHEYALKSKQLCNIWINIFSNF